VSTGFQCCEKFWCEVISSLNAYSPIAEPPTPVLAISLNDPIGKPILKDAPALNLLWLKENEDNKKIIISRKCLVDHIKILKCF
jgi:hypothetical protein